METVLKAHDGVTEKDRFQADALSFEPVGSAGSSLGAIFSMSTRALGTAALLSPEEALTLAERIELVVRDLEDPKPADFHLDRSQWPYWQVTPCPGWCAVEHKDEDPVAEREHDTEFPPALDLATHGRVSDTDHWVEIGIWHPTAALQGLLGLYLEGCPPVLMYPDEAKEAEASIRNVVLDRVPNARAMPSYGEHDENPTLSLGDGL